MATYTPLIDVNNEEIMTADSMPFYAVGENVKFVDKEALHYFAKKVVLYTESRTTYQISSITTNADSVDITIDIANSGGGEPMTPNNGYTVTLNLVNGADTAYDVFWYSVNNGEWIVIGINHTTPFSLANVKTIKFRKFYQEGVTFDPAKGTNMDVGTTSGATDIASLDINEETEIILTTDVVWYITA